MNPKPAFLHSFTSLQPSKKKKSSRFPWQFAQGYFLERPWLVGCKKSQVSLESNPHNYLGKQLNHSSKVPSEWGEEKKKDKKKEGILLPNTFPSTQAQTWSQLYRKKGTDKAHMLWENGARNCLLLAGTGTASQVRPWHHQCPEEDITQQFSFSVRPVQGIDYIPQSLAVINTCS